jgi:hypothetical protein
LAATWLRSTAAVGLFMVGVLPLIGANIVPPPVPRI